MNIAPEETTLAARILDHKKPLWWRNISRPLKMGSYQQCVIGQIYQIPEYFSSPTGPAPCEMFDRLFEHLTGVSYDSLSFDNSLKRPFSTFADLDCWNREIEARKKLDVLYKA